NFVLGRDANAPWRKDDRDWYPRLSELHAIITPRYQALGLPVPDYQDLQNQLCEFAKYFEFSSGAKTKLKRAYAPPEAPKSARAKKAPATTKLDVGPQGIPFMITRELRERLARVGFIEEQIKNMRPAEAWEHIRARETGAHVEPAGELPGEQQRTQPESAKFSNDSDKAPNSTTSN